MKTIKPSLIIAAFLLSSIAAFAGKPVDLSKVSSSTTVKNGDTLTGVLGDTLKASLYKISIADGATVTLNDVVINGVNDTAGSWAGITCKGNCTIVLEGRNTVKGFFENYPGIYVPKGKTLTIKGSGSLDASSNGWAPGIGGGLEIDCGNIEIEGGYITATGGSLAAGIGSGSRASVGNISISGGNVRASAGRMAAGIGSGNNGSVGNILISDGSVSAMSGDYSAGIGGGDNSSVKNIIISGGVIVSAGGEDGAAIGAGDRGTIDSIVIDGAKTQVTALAGNGAPYTIGYNKRDDSAVVIIGGFESDNVLTSLFTYPVTETYTIVFDKNGGTGTMADMVVYRDFPQALNVNTFTRDGYVFVGWNTKIDGRDEEGEDDEEDDEEIDKRRAIAFDDMAKVANLAKAGESVTLYAQWFNGDLSKLLNNYVAQDGDTLKGTLLGKVKVSIADGATVTLNNVTIDGDYDYDHLWAGLTCEGNCTIVLEGKNTVKGFFQYQPGIYVPSGKTLTIKGSGSLDASSNGEGAGIGCAARDDCGNVVIESGTITATGGSGAAGVGAARSGSAGDIKIIGGTVVATGGSSAAGIGGGYYGAVGKITIDGQSTKVTATAGSGAPYSVGAGLNKTSVDVITIGGLVVDNVSASPFNYPVAGAYTVVFDKNGGSGTMENQTFFIDFNHFLNANDFTRKGYYFSGWNTQADGSGIGYENGESVMNLAGNGESVTLYAQWFNGDLSKLKTGYEAHDGETLTGTLGGRYKISIADGATVTLDDVTIDLADTSQLDWAALSCEGNCTIVLEGTNKVKSFSYLHSGVFVPEGKTLTIKGSGSLDVVGNIRAAAIGCGYGEHCGNVVIEGGNITALGGEGGAGIGSGHTGNVGNIIIRGGTVVAEGGKSAVGIGCGLFGVCGDIVITDSVAKVTAIAGENREFSIGADIYVNEVGSITIGGEEFESRIEESPFTFQAYKVAFSANGGSGTMENQRFVYGKKTTLSKNVFTRSGFLFAEWNTKADGKGDSYKDKAEVKDLTNKPGATVKLYAQWVKLLSNSDVTVASIDEQTYTGKDITPEVVVKDGKTKLVKGTDYTIAYSDNKNVGKATVTLTGKGNYSGEVKVAFTIAKASAKLTTAPSAVKDLVYTGKSQTLVKAGKAEHGTLLYKLGKDGEYSEKLPTAKKAGKYTVYYKVEGNENYSDVKEKSLTVEIAAKTSFGRTRLVAEQYRMERDFDLKGRKLQGKPKARGAYCGRMKRAE